MRATMDCLRVLEELKLPARCVRVILNRVTPYGLDNELVAKTLGREPDLLIPYTRWYEDAVDAGRPLITYQTGGSGTMEIESLAASIRALAPVSV
jgi:Flp pilus assembly CpaE family ATPase